MGQTQYVTLLDKLLSKNWTLFRQPALNAQYLTIYYYPHFLRNQSDLAGFTWMLLQRQLLAKTILSENI